MDHVQIPLNQLMLSADTLSSSVSSWDTPYNVCTTTTPFMDLLKPRIYEKLAVDQTSWDRNPSHLVGKLCEVLRIHVSQSSLVRVWM